jgi:serine/threonine protein kinase
VPGAEPFGRYVLLKRLGSGAMGDVHLARPLEGQTPSPVVVKRLHGRLTSDPNIVRRFHHEAQLAAYVESPYVAKVFDVGAVGDVLYIAMEYIAGWPLVRVIEDLTLRGELPQITAAIRLIEGAVAGLAALHRSVHPETNAPLEIVHRDVAPKNIMVGEDGKTRIIDLGIGRSSARAWKTRTGLLVGTPGYMPPEQVFGDAIDHRADIYAAGVVIFELLTLRSYIERGPLGQMLQASRVVKPRAPSSIRSDVPRALDAVVMKAVALSPDDRFSSAAELFSALREAVPVSGTLDGKMLVADLLWNELTAKQTEVSALLKEDRTALLDTLPSGPPLSHAPLRKRPGVPRWLPLTVLAAGAAIGVALADLQRPPEEPIVEPIEAPAEIPAPTASAIEKAVEIEVAPARRPPKKQARAVKAKLPTPMPTRETPVVKQEEMPEAHDPQRLVQRARALKRRLPVGSPAHGEADRILGNLNLGMASGREDWADLARELDRLEKE